MRRLGLVLAGAALCPLAATAHERSEIGSEPAPEDDLACAIFSAYVFGVQNEQMDTQAKIGIAASMAYFIGRWEAATGGDLKEAMKTRAEALTLADIGSLGVKCGERMQSLGERMQIAGQSLEELGGGDASDEAAFTGSEPSE